jgi:transcriptional regulator with XRE-family HTH domain
MSTTLLDFGTRRKSLKMPIEVLVKRSGVPRPTVCRILQGKVDKMWFGHVHKVAGVLGVAFGTPAIEPEELRQREARRKARLLTRLTQGTMGLEAQAVSPALLKELEEQTVTKLLADSGRKLWSE